MRLPDSLIEKLVVDVAGKDTYALVSLIKDKVNVSEFKIAEKMNLSVNQVRNMLYRLQESNLVVSTRKKDKAKGWYIYYWTFDVKKARELIIERLQGLANELEHSITHAGHDVGYTCKTCKVRYTPEVALDLQFLCEECGSVVVQEDVEKKLKEEQSLLDEVKEELKIALESEEKTLDAFGRKEKEEAQKKPVGKQGVKTHGMKHEKKHFKKSHARKVHAYAKKHLRKPHPQRHVKHRAPLPKRHEPKKPFLKRFLRRK